MIVQYFVAFHTLGLHKNHTPFVNNKDSPPPLTNHQLLYDPHQFANGVLKRKSILINFQFVLSIIW